MADPKKASYYDVLGVAPAATLDQIHAAFVKLATEYQMQGKPANIDAVERFREIARAYRILSDQEQRSRYDRLGQVGVDSVHVPAAMIRKNWRSGSRSLGGFPITCVSIHQSKSSFFGTIF